MLPPALRHPRFRLYWVGLILLWAGNQMQIWTLLWHIRTLTEQPLALGAVGLIRVVPLIALSLLAGPVADAFSRRRVMAVTQSAFALIALALAGLTWQGQASLGALYGLIALHAVSQSFDFPARESLIPGLVPPGDLHNAFSLRIFAIQIGSLAGPALSGQLISRYGLMIPYLVSAAAFVAFLLLLGGIGPVPQDRPAVRGPVINRTVIEEGLRFTLRHPLIFPSMLLDFLATALTRADTLMPIFARDILGVGAVAYGWLSAAQSIGATAAGVILSRARSLRRQGGVLLVAVAGVGLGTLAFGSSTSFALSMAALILVGASDAVSSVVRNTIRQGRTPDRLRGRMVSVNQIFFMGGPQLGEVRAGLLGQVLGVPLAVASGGVACLAALAWAAARWPRLRRYQGDEEISAFAD